jgi:hypothetical protein
VKRTTLSLAAMALLGAGLLAGCGGGNDEDPAEVLERTFSGDKQVDSGVIDVSFSASAEGESSGEASGSLSGPFQSEGEGALPSFDLTASLTASGAGQELDFEGGVISTGDAGFVSYQGTDYEVDDEIFQSFREGFEESSGQTEAKPANPCLSADVLDTAGVDPVNWLTNLSNEGTEDVEGTETIHVSGDANVEQLVEDVQAIQAECGEQVSEVGPLELGIVEDAIDEASIDVYSGVDDDILRKLDFSFAIDVPAAAGGGGSADISFSLTLSGVNEEQTIEAPTDARPLSELAPELGGLGLLGGLGAGGTTPAPVVPGAGGGGAAPSQEFLDCLSQAETAEDAQACEP